MGKARETTPLGNNETCGPLAKTPHSHRPTSHHNLVKLHHVNYPLAAAVRRHSEAPASRPAERIVWSSSDHPTGPDAAQLSLTFRTIALLTVRLRGGS